MKNSKIYEDFALIHGRAFRTFVFVEILFLFLVLCFWKIQIIDFNKYWKKSEANRVREVILPSLRGLITDRSGRIILAKNEASFKASIIRENCEDFDESCQKIARFLNLEEEVLRERIKKHESLPLFMPIVVKDNLSIEEVSRIEARKLEMPELIIQAEPKRSYPFGSFAAHVIGYIQELSQEELKSGLYSERRLGDAVGKAGTEKEHEVSLVGEDGLLIEIVDSLGRRKGEIERKEPDPGQNIRLALDFDLQKKAEKILEGREGAVIVLDNNTGEILALASYPSFDPNKFINRFTPEEWLDLVQNPEFPLENRAIRGLYSPGSVFKLTIALAALDLSLITEKTSYFCSGMIRIYGHPFSCWFRGGHGAVDLYQAIRHSCNIYFYRLGKKMGIEEIYRYAKSLGFGEKTGIDLPGEKEGLIPHPQWKKKVRNAPWYPGETISVSIGQGPLLVTPIQVAVHTALIANRGRKIVPYLLKSEANIHEKRDKIEGLAEDHILNIERTIFEKIIRGMWKAANENGTARAAKIDGYDVCGKTGSTQLISTLKPERSAKKRKEVKTHSWFTGFAPRDNPKVVVTILVEYGGMGGATAAPLARQLFNLYREKYD